MSLEDKIKAYAKKQATDTDADLFKAVRDRYEAQTKQLVDVVETAGVPKDKITSPEWHEGAVFPECKFLLLDVPCTVRRNNNEISVYVATQAAAVLLIDSADPDRVFNKANLERILIENVTPYVEITPDATKSEPKQDIPIGNVAPDAENTTDATESEPKQDTKANA